MSYIKIVKLTKVDRKRICSYLNISIRTLDRVIKSYLIKNKTNKYIILDELIKFYKTEYIK